MLDSKLKTQRNLLKLSQSKLSQLSQVSRFKIVLYELGEGKLTDEEQRRIQEAIRSQALRFRETLAEIEAGVTN